MKHLAIVGAAVLILDWVLGAMCASGSLPRWLFLLFPIPFGALHVWMESSWMGTHYDLLGHTTGDVESGAVHLFGVPAQTISYTALDEWLRNRQAHKAAG